MPQLIKYDETNHLPFNFLVTALCLQEENKEKNFIEDEFGEIVFRPDGHEVSLIINGIEVDFARIVRHIYERFNNEINLRAAKEADIKIGGMFDSLRQKINDIEQLLDIEVSKLFPKLGEYD